MRIRDKSGFTLVEIMIVVVIIGMLAAIAIPNYMNTRAQASLRACISNLRLLDSAIQMYQLDNGVWPNNLNQLTSYFQNIPTVCPGDSSVTYTLNPPIGGSPGYASCPTHGRV